jgi:hypothetical protein
MSQLFRARLAHCTPFYPLKESGGIMPTNLERAIARKAQSPAEIDFIHTIFLRCVALCLVHLLLAVESPMIADVLRLSSLT